MPAGAYIPKLPPDQNLFQSKSVRSPAEKTGEGDKACCHIPPKHKERMLYMCRQAAKPPFCCAEKCAADVKRSINTICEKAG